jgi:hypothetical protein
MACWVIRLEDAACDFGDSNRVAAYKGEMCSVRVEVLWIAGNLEHM